MDDERDHRPPRWPISVVDVVVSLAFVAVVAGALAWFVRTYGDASLSISVPAPEPITGTVTFDGKPLADATVIFAPTDRTAGSGATGVTDKSGYYRLRYLRDGVLHDGVMPGGYGVKFSKMVLPDGRVFDPRSQGYVGCGAGRESIPTEYCLKAAFTVEVTKDKRIGYDFALVKKD